MLSGLLGILLGLWLGLAGWGGVAWAQDSGEGSPSALTLQERQELQDLRLEKRLQQLLDRRLTSSPEVQDRIEFEVDRAFERTTTLLNILLSLLTSIPLLAALGIWLLRRSVISELVSEVRSQLETEVLAQLKQQKVTTIQDIEAIKSEALEQLDAMVHDAQEVLSALKTQIEVAHQEIDSLKLEAASQLEKMVMDAQQMKDQTIQELTNLLPLSTQEALPPDVQPRIGKLTALLESLKAAIPQITFTASDYLKQGNALFFEGRYDDAVAAYDRAIQLHPELYEAWFSKASTLMLLQQYEEATVAYTTATQLRPDAYDAWMGRGAAQARQHHFEAAIAAYSQALELRPEDYLACYNRGNAVLESGQAAAAIEDFTQALALKPDLGRALVRRALAHQVLGQHGDAIADCQQALALNETDAEAWYTLACSYALQSPEDDGRDMARTALTQAIALAPTNRERARQDPVFGFLQGEEGVW